MSVQELEAVRKIALALSERERAELASELVRSLDGPQDDDAAAAWDIEICRRINDIAAGNATLIDADEALANARRRLEAN